MLERIDNFLISLAQSMVYRFELHTPISRKGLISFFTLLELLTLIVMCLLFISICSQECNKNISPMVLVCLIILYMLFFDIKEASVKQKASNEPPQEIHYRGMYRLFMWMYSLTVLFFVPILFEYITPISVSSNIKLWGLIFVLYIFLIFCSEYLICTTPTPPNDKVENETNDLQQAIQVTN